MTDSALQQHGLWSPTVTTMFDRDAEAVILEGDAAESLKSIPSGSLKLIITSPPYNIGKVYEHATHLEKYLENLTPIVDQLIRVLASDGLKVSDVNSAW